jgi:hypothetical protein
MKTHYKTIVFQFLAAVICVVTFMPLAHAVTNTPLDCPAVIAVPGGYRLTKNSTCPGFSWHEDNKFFNLNGFTLTLGRADIDGEGLSMRNGGIQLKGLLFLEAARSLTLSNLSIKGSNLGDQNYIETGIDNTIKNCNFSNFSGVALMFYYGSGGRVTDSVFIRNKTGISIQRDNNVMIENNIFVNNGRGVNLHNEYATGVNNNTIQHNTFQNNGVGINIHEYLGHLPTMQGNRIIGNLIDRSSRSGLYIYLELECPSSIVCTSQNSLLVSKNQFSRNGFASDTGELDDNDGIVAQAFYYSGEAYPLALADVTLANNRADRNADLGFDVNGVTDGGGNTAHFNGNPAQCDGVVCRRLGSVSGAISLNAPATVLQSNSLNELQSILLETIPEAPLPSDQVRHQ